SLFSLLLLLAAGWTAADRGVACFCGLSDRGIENQADEGPPATRHVPAPDGWTVAAPREEIRPSFAYEPTGGSDGGGAFAIAAARGEGLEGWWPKAFTIGGGSHYRFRASYQARDVAVPRRSILVKLHWRDAQGKAVPLDEPAVTGYLRGATAMAETEFPNTKSTNGVGWTEVSGTYRAPQKAARALLELHLQWAPGGEVRWSGVELAETTAPPARKVRLAAVHFRPRDGHTPEENCRLYEPLIAEAARQKADLVVLGETLTYYGLGKRFAEVAEPIPGPATAYFGEL